MKFCHKIIFKPNFLNFLVLFAGPTRERFSILVPSIPTLHVYPWYICVTVTDSASVLCFSGRQLRYVRYMLSPVRLSSVCLSVCRLSVTLVHPTRAVAIFGNFFPPYDSSETLVLWCQKPLVGDAPFPLKFALKVTPLSSTTISTKIGS